MLSLTDYGLHAFLASYIALNGLGIRETIFLCVAHFEFQQQLLDNCAEDFNASITATSNATDGANTGARKRPSRSGGIVKIFPDGPELNMQPCDDRNSTAANPDAVTAEVWCIIKDIGQIDTKTMTVIIKTDLYASVSH